MDRCSNYSHDNSVGPCSCGYFHGVTSPCSAFSILFAMPNKPTTEEADFNHLSSSSYSSVDCTLSLGTPSTRQTNDNSVMHQRRPSMSNLCWDIFQPPTGSQKNGRGSASSSSSSSSSSNGILNNMGGDSLLARRCANCDTTSTPLWRNGPRGPKSLCNACGIRYKKEERRATATNPMEPQHLISHHHHHPWSYAAQPQKSPYVEDDDGESDGGVSFLSWRLNVPVRDRPSLVHDLT